MVENRTWTQIELAGFFKPPATLEDTEVTEEGNENDSKMYLFLTMIGSSLA